MTVRASTTINAPASTIFDILADPRQHQRIDGSGALQGSTTGPDRLELGSEFGMSMKQGAPYKVLNRVVEYDEDRLIAWRHKSPHRWRYELAPQADGSTTVTETWDLAPVPAPLRAVYTLIFGGKTKKGIETTLANLKRAAEQDQ